jgi:hypothetical protein
MNARVKAIWNLSIGISVLILLFSGFQLFNLQEEMSNLKLNFENEEIGTDKILKKNIEILETNLKKRDEFKFNIEDSPTDLTNVVQFDGFDPRFNRNSKHIYVTAIIGSSRSNMNKAIVLYREDEFTVMKGDSVAGGLITNITTKEVHFEKNGKEFVFYKGLETEILE